MSGHYLITMKYSPQLKIEYQNKIIPLLKQELKRENSFAVPRLEKVVLNLGAGKSLENKEFMPRAEEALAKISGQKPKVTLAKKSIAGFKIRTGLPIGLQVTLRGNRMYEFVQRLVQVTLPRVRDFRGLSLKGFDGHGNYTIGIKEHMAFPEISPEEGSESMSLEVVIVTTAKNNKEGELLLKAFGFPFRDKEEEKEKVEKPRVAGSASGGNK